MNRANDAKGRAMRLILKRRLAAAGVAVVVALGAGASSAVACHGDGARAAANTTFFGAFQRAGGSQFEGWHGLWGWHRSWGVVTTYLGLSSDQVKTDLKSGQTLAQIANATPNKSADGLVAALV